MSLEMTFIHSNTHRGRNSTGAGGISAATCTRSDLPFPEPRGVEAEPRGVEAGLSALAITVTGLAEEAGGGGGGGRVLSDVTTTAPPLSVRIFLSVVLSVVTPSSVLSVLSVLTTNSGDTSGNFVLGCNSRLRFFFDWW